MTKRGAMAYAERIQYEQFDRMSWRLKADSEGNTRPVSGRLQPVYGGIRWAGWVLFGRSDIRHQPTTAGTHVEPAAGGGKATFPGCD